MNAAIVSELPEDLPHFVAALALKELGSDVYQVTCSKPTTLNEGGSSILYCGTLVIKGVWPLS